MKKSLLLFIALFIFVFAFVIHSSLIPAQFQDFDGDGIPDQLSEENIQNQTNATLEKFHYLSQAWKELLLKKTFIVSADAFLKRLDSFALFLILFGQRYDLSLPLFLLIILWIIVLIKSTQTLKGLGISLFYSLLGGLGATIILAQIGILRLIISGFIFLFYSSDSKVRQVLFFGIMFFLLLFLFVVWSIINKALEKRRKVKLEKKAEKKEKKLIKVTEAVEEGMEEQ